MCVRTPTAKLLTAILCLSGMGNRGLQDITSFFLQVSQLARNRTYVQASHKLKTFWVWDVRNQGAFGFDSMMLARLLLLLAMVLLILQGIVLKPLIVRIGEVGVLLLATTACACYDWTLAAAGAFSGQAWTAYVICALRTSTTASESSFTLLLLPAVLSMILVLLQLNL